MVMRKHQRYFPVYDKESNLMPVFVTVANGTIDPRTVIEGGHPPFSFAAWHSHGRLHLGVWKGFDCD